MKLFMKHVGYIKDIIETNNCRVYKFNMRLQKEFKSSMVTDTKKLLNSTKLNLSD